jgi:soluble lytic murein transglycosylase-like protein
MEAERRRAQYFPLVMAIACEAGVPGHLLDALIAQESRYNPAAFSQKGAAGLTQLMPGTAAGLGVSNRFDVVQNLRGGARYLRTQLDEFGSYDLALGAYNAGPGRVRQYKSLPPFRETLMYVKTILNDVRTALVGSADYGLPSQAARVRTASFMGF